MIQRIGSVSEQRGIFSLIFIVGGLSLVMLTIEDGDDTDSRMDMLLGKKRASDRRAWLETYGNMADIEV